MHLSKNEPKTQYIEKIKGTCSKRSLSSTEILFMHTYMKAMNMVSLERR